MSKHGCKKMKDNVFSLDLKKYPLNQRIIEEVDFPSFYGMQEVKTPIFVHRASQKISPCIIVTSCMHGDEISGMRIAQKLMTSRLKLQKGTLIIVPLVNIYGFLNKVRYLPDRKDLNRFFPGKNVGSFGTRFAYFLMRNFSEVGDCFIDLHSGPAGRLNIPQVRCDLKNKAVRNIVNDIDIPLAVNSSLRDGSFRQAIDEKGKICLVFEGGEGLRIDESVTQSGMHFIKSVLRHYKMITPGTRSKNQKHLLIKKTNWIRASEGGVLINKFTLGHVVKKGQVIGELRNIKGELLRKIECPANGVILGMRRTALVMAGDSLYNLGHIGKNQPFEEEIFDWDEI